MTLEAAPAISVHPTNAIQIAALRGTNLDAWLNEHRQSAPMPEHPGASPLWLRVLRDGLNHQPILLEATSDGKSVGQLPLALVQSNLFGRFLVSLPYVNASGLVAPTQPIARQLLDAAVALADQERVRYFELRQEQEQEHSALTEKRTTKVLMRLPLPANPDALWNSFKSKLRSQIRSSEKHEFSIAFGGQELLTDFYSVFSRNMRDLGTPVFSKRLFAAILHEFSEHAELCVLRLQNQPAAAALLMHGRGVTEVPSASSLRRFNSSGANMVMYWHLLKRAVERGQSTFDFGRSTIDSNTYRFKKQWGAEPSPSVWQYYVRQGTMGDMRPESAKFRLASRIWQRLPLWLANAIGPHIVRGIP